LADQPGERKILAVEIGVDRKTVEIGRIEPDRVQHDRAAAPFDSGAFDIRLLSGDQVEAHCEVGEVEIPATQFADADGLAARRAPVRQIVELQVDADVFRLEFLFRPVEGSLFEQELDAGGEFAVFKPRRAAERDDSACRRPTEPGDVFGEFQRCLRPPRRDVEFELHVGHPAGARRDAAAEIDPGSRQELVQEVAGKQQVIPVGPEAAAHRAELLPVPADRADVPCGRERFIWRQRNQQVDSRRLQPESRIDESHAAAGNGVVPAQPFHPELRRAEGEAVSLDAERPGGQLDAGDADSVAGVG